MFYKRQMVKRYQAGSALIIGLTILLLMLILGTAGMRTTIMEEKMAGNSRDFNNSFQAAEQGLTDGEQDVLNKDPVTRKKVRPDDYIKTNFSSSCINGTDRALDGLCLPSTTALPQWLIIDWKAIATNDTTPLPYRKYGKATKINGETPPPVPLVVRQPRYILEYLASVGSRVVGRGPTPQNIYYRVTTQGYGVAMTDDSEPLARVMLQTTYGM